MTIFKYNLLSPFAMTEDMPKTRYLFAVHTDSFYYSSEPCKGSIDELLKTVDDSAYIKKPDDRDRGYVTTNHIFESRLGSVKRSDIETVVTEPDNSEIILTGGDVEFSLFAAFLSVLDYLEQNKANNVSIVIPLNAVFGYRGKPVTEFNGNLQKKYLSQAHMKDESYTCEIEDNNVVFRTAA